MKEEKVLEILKKYNQEHIIKFLQTLEENKKEELINQILKIDFEQIQKLYENRNNITSEKGEITPAKYIDKYKLSEKEKLEYIKLGEEVITKNEYAFAVMAGGQGTRLGCEGPKGKYVLKIEPQAKSLFEILSDTLKQSNQKYKISIPWYIMTSKENNAETIAFFEENNYFGYNKNDIIFFIQNELPLVSEEGKLFIGENNLIKQAADGNGGIFESMLKSGCIEDMKKRNIKWLFIGGVDNCLLKMVDPLLLGITIKQNNKIASKTIVKSNPYEKVGVFCKKDNKPKVIEYTELSEQMAEMVDENNELLYGESHIMCNLFSLEAILQISKEELQYHSAFKKSDYMDQTGTMVKVDKPNAYKFEAFIFDSFENFDDITLMRGKREEEFAPVKNAQGTDSPETAIKLYNSKN